MSNKADTPHAWVLAGYSTNKLRAVAEEMGKQVSGIVLEGGRRRTDNDNEFAKAMEALAVAADHIDRLHGDKGPHIVSTSTSMDGDELYLFGVDIMGGVWQYAFPQDGWLKLGSRVLQYAPPDNVTKLPEGDKVAPDSPTE